MDDTTSIHDRLAAYGISHRKTGDNGHHMLSHNGSDLGRMNAHQACWLLQRLDGGASLSTELIEATKRAYYEARY